MKAETPPYVSFRMADSRTEI